MAKRRLNKKVALISSAVFLFLAAAVIVVVLHLSRSPTKFISDGDEAIKAARQATDKQLKERLYGTAERSYGRARSFAKDDALRVEILFKLADLYVETDQWRNVMGCWNAIVQIDPANIRARLGRLNYIYIMADSGAAQLWPDVKSQASEFLDVAEKTNLLAANVSDQKAFGVRLARADNTKIGPYLYLLRGRAAFEETRMGAAAETELSLKQAMDDLQKARQLEPSNANACFYLAQAFRLRGEVLASKGNAAEKDKGDQDALKVLNNAIETAEPNDPVPYINLMTMKLAIARGRSIEDVKALEPQYLSLVQKFGSSAAAYSALAAFYNFSPMEIDKAVAAADKAIELDSSNVIYAINAANLHYRRFSNYDRSADLYKSVEIAKNALDFPDAQDKPGPRSLLNRTSRIALYIFLANSSIEQVFQTPQTAESQRQQWLKQAEDAVHQIEQLFGSGDDPQVVIWQGMLEFARGNNDTAVRKLYTVYEQLKAGGIEGETSSYLQNSYAQLSYSLARGFMNTTEIGAVAEFLASALNSRIAWTRPDAMLDYAEVLMRLGMWQQAISNIDVFDSNIGPSYRSRLLRVKGYIDTGQFDDAEKTLAKMDAKDPNTASLKLNLLQAEVGQVQRSIARKQVETESSKLFSDANSPAQQRPGETYESMQAELNGYSSRMLELADKLLDTKPGLVSEETIAFICRSYMARNKANEVVPLVEKFLGYFPDSTTALFYKGVLSENAPANVSPQRQKEIELRVLSGISEPDRRAMTLAMFYNRNNETAKANEEFQKSS